MGPDLAFGFINKRSGYEIRDFGCHSFTRLSSTLINMQIINWNLIYIVKLEPKFRAFATVSREAMCKEILLKTSKISN